LQPVLCAVCGCFHETARRAFRGVLRRAVSEFVGAVGRRLNCAMEGGARRCEAWKCNVGGRQPNTWSAKRAGVLCVVTCVVVSITQPVSAMVRGIALCKSHRNVAPWEIAHSSSARRAVESDAALRVRMAELTSQAAAALRIASWTDGIAPTIDAPLELERREILAALVSDVPPPPRGAWAVLRAGRDPTGDTQHGSNNESDGASVADRARSTATKLRSASLSRDEDLDRACALLVKHALVKALACTVAAQAEDGLGPAGPLPADIVRRIADSLPLPPDHPGSDPARQRTLKRLERTRVGARLPKSIEAEARNAETDFREAHAVARAWLARLDVIHGMLARMADVEGVAVIRVSRAIRLASAGWDPEIASTMDARPLGDDGATPLTGTERPFDRVLAEIRTARNKGFACVALAESLQAARVVDVEVVESVAADGDGVLQLGRRRVRVTGERLDDWRRACGVRPNPTQSPPPARGSAPSRRIRDAPFGIKPLG